MKLTKKKASLSVKRFLLAIKGSGGYISHIAESMGCSRRTVYNWLEKHEQLREALEDETETTLDMAEVKIVELIKAGNITAVMYYLNNRGKSRGYGDRGVASPDAVKLKIEWGE